MDRDEAERVAHLAKGAVELGISLALLPIKLLLRAVRPVHEEAPWSPVPYAAAEPGGGTAAPPAAAAAPAPAAPPAAPSPHASDLTSAEASRLRENHRVAQASADSPGPEVHVEAPWEGYDRQTVTDVLTRLRGADPATIAVVRLYEQTHKKRLGILRATGGE